MEGGELGGGEREGRGEVEELVVFVELEFANEVLGEVVLQELMGLQSHSNIYLVALHAY